MAAFALAAGEREQLVNRGPLFLTALAVACVACGKAPEGNAWQPPITAENDVGETASLNLETIEPGEPGGLPDDRTLLDEPSGPIDPRSAEGAGQVMQLFGGLLEQRKFGDAYRLWSDSGRASGLSEAQFAADYDKYSEIHAEVGKPGTSGGAAGSIYTDVPFRLYGKLKSGGAFNRIGTVTLRRVNDVPGSSEAQRKWHIYKSDLDARS